MSSGVHLRMFAVLIVRNTLHNNNESLSYGCWLVSCSVYVYMRLTEGATGYLGN